MSELKFYNMGLAAKKLGVSTPTLSSWVKQGFIAPYARSTTGRCLFTESQLDGFQEQVPMLLHKKTSLAPPGFLTIGMFSERTGIPTHQLRYWDKSGVLVPAQRTERGERLYSEAQLEDILKECNSSEVR